MRRRVLAIRPGGIGDCILSFPALESLAPSEVWLPRAMTPLVKFANTVRAIADTGLDLLGIPGLLPPQRLLETLASFGEIHSWYGGNREDFREATRHLNIRFHRSLPPADSAEHAADFFAAQVHAPVPAVPQIQIHAEKQGFIAIHPFSGSPKKNWPHFDELARRLAQPVAWCASPEQPISHDALITNDLAEVARWIAQAKLYIGNDSGITHLAAAVGTPVIAIFQASNPLVWAPRGPHVTILQTPSVDDVLTAIRAFSHIV